MSYTFQFNPNGYEFDSYGSKFMSLILKHIDDPRPLYEKGYFRSEDNTTYSYTTYPKIYPTFTQFLNGEYSDVLYYDGTIELNLNEKEEKLFNTLVKELVENKQTELLTKVLEDNNEN